MKPFELEAVLKYRKRLKEIAQHKFEEAKKHYNDVKVQLATKTANAQSLADTLQELQKAGITIEDHILYETRISLLRSEIESLEKQLIKKHEQVIRERKILMQKSKEQRVLEKLKEKQNRAWLQFLDKKEAAMLDEIAVIYGKK